MSLIYGGVLRRKLSVVIHLVFPHTDFSIVLADNIAHRKYFIVAFTLLITFTSY